MLLFTSHLFEFLNNSPLIGNTISGRDPDFPKSGITYLCWLLPWYGNKNLFSLHSKVKYLKFRHFEWTKTYTKRRFGYDYSPICKICEYATKQFEENSKNIIDLNKFWNDKDCNRFNVEKFLKDQ